MLHAPCMADEELHQQYQSKYRLSLLQVVACELDLRLVAELQKRVQCTWVKEYDMEQFVWKEEFIHNCFQTVYDNSFLFNLAGVSHYEHFDGHYLYLFLQTPAIQTSNISRWRAENRPAFLWHLRRQFTIPGMNKSA